MKEHTAIRLRLYPTPKHQSILKQWMGAQRFLYNRALDVRKKQYEDWCEQGKPKDFKWINAHYLIVQWLPTIRQEHDWINDVPSQSMQQTLRHLDTAFNRWLRGKSNYPRFKRKSNRDSITFSNVEVKEHHLVVDKSWLRVRLPKIGEITKAKLHMDLPAGRLMKTVMSFSAGQYHISLLYEVPEGYNLRHSDQQRLSKCGIDLGVVKPLTVAYLNSQGEERYKVFGIEERKHLIELERRRRKHSRVTSRRQLAYNKRCKAEVRRCQKTGKDYTPPSRRNLDKANLRVQKDYLNESNYRKDFGHKLSNLLASKFDVIKFEDLKLKDMTKQVRKNEDGSSRKNVSAKSGLNREMLRIGLGFIVKETERKSKLYGGTTKFVNPRYTSQRCHVCGHISKDNRKSQAVFQCTSCGFTQNADVNAAFNIASRKPL